MINKKYLYSCVILLIIGFFVISINTSLAVTTIMNESKEPTGGFDCTKGAEKYTAPEQESFKQYCGDYELNDLVGIFIKVAQWILGIVGSLALLFFIYGGVMFLISGGSSEKVSKAKEILTGAVLGVVIVLTSYMIIGFVLKSLGYTSTDWFKIP